MNVMKLIGAWNINTTIQTKSFVSAFRSVHFVKHANDICKVTMLSSEPIN